MGITSRRLTFFFPSAAYALTINVGGSLGTVSAEDFLNVTDARLLSNVGVLHHTLLLPANKPDALKCQNQCSNATSTIQVCFFCAIDTAVPIDYN